MAANSENTQQLKGQLQLKVQKLLTEFAEGKISREQFHVIYARYNDQMHALEQGLAVVSSPGETIGIRQAHMGKAVGLAIYHNKSGTFVDTLGQFDVPPQQIAPILNDYTQMMAEQRFTERRVVQVGDNAWLVFAPGKFTTVITLFYKEPSVQQGLEIERLHHDFEFANATALSTLQIDKTRLAYPFLVFVQQKLTRDRKP
jgi:hypothetical protein